MSDSPTAGSASLRFASVDLMLDFEEMRIALLEIGTAIRLHSTEVEHSTNVRMDPHDTRRAWRKANATMAEAVARMSAAFGRMHNRRRALLNALDANDPVMIALKST
jgi:hypothetical protein